MAKVKEEEPVTTTVEDDVGGNKMEMVRRTLKELGINTKPRIIQQHILNKYGADLPIQIVSSYKSVLKKEFRRKKRAAGGDGGGEEDGGRRGSRDLTLDFIVSIRKWESRLGAKKIQEVIQALYSKEME